jgi:hypothetical protein
VEENKAVGTAVGSLSSTDVDTGDTFTYTLSGTGNDNAKFSLVGGSLQTAEVFNYETVVSHSYTIHVKTTDNNGGTYEKDLVVTIVDVNDAPVVSDVSKSTNEDTVLNFALADFSGKFSDEDGNALANVKITSLPSHGTLKLGVSSVTVDQVIPAASIGNLSYTPDLNVSGSDSFGWNGSDGAVYAASGANVNITVAAVNDAPSMDAITDPAAIDEDAGEQTVAFSGVTPGPADESGQTVTVTATSSNTSLIPDPTVTYSGGAAGSLKYTPVANANGSATITVTANDGQSQNNTFSRTFTVVVNAVNDAPANSVPGAQNTAEDTALTFNSANSNLITVSDVDASVLKVTLTATNGKLSLSGITGLSFNTGTGTNDSVMTFTGSAANINTALNGMQFIPTANFNGLAGLEIVTNDQGQTGSGGTLSDSDTVDINVSGVNDAPTDISLSSSTVNENATLNTVVGTLSSTDADAGDSHTYSLVTGEGSTNNDKFVISGNELRVNGAIDFESTPSLSIRVQTKDNGTPNLSFEKSFTITVNDINEAPTNITLSANSVAENEASGTTIGTLSATDVDASENFTYSLQDNTTYPDNTSFQITGNSLKTAASLNFEAKSSYSIQIRVTDHGGLTYDKVFTVTVTNVNEAATDISLSSSNVLENQAIGTVVGSLSNNDPDALDTFTYSLVTGTGDTDNASFAIDTNSLKTAAVFDRETKSSYSIRVRVQDAGGLFYEKAFTITVDNQNEAPTAITLSNDTIAENAGANAVVGALSTTDVDAGDTFTYTLVTGQGDADNSLFNMNGSDLRATSSLDFESVHGPTYSVRVRTTDSGGLTFETSFTITVTNVAEAPVVTGFSKTLTEDGSFSFAASDFTSHFSDQDAGDSLSQIKITTLPSHGTLKKGTTTLVLNDVVTLAELGTLVYEPTANYFGSDSFQWDGRDAALYSGSPATVSLTVTGVNDPPTLDAISDMLVNESAGLQTVNLAGISAGPNESDTPLVVTATSSNTGLIPNPTVVYTSPNATGSLTFTPAAGLSGSATITVTVNDSQVSNNTFQRQFTVTVTALNDPPVITAPATQTTAEDTNLQLISTNGNGVLVTDDALAGSILQVKLTASNGVITLGGTSNLIFTSGDGTDDATMTFTGTLPSINGALEGMRFTPTADYNGAASLEIEVNDQGHSGAGGPKTSTVSVAITVTAVNDAPVNNVPGAQTTAEDTALTFSSGAGRTISVSDVDASTLRVTLTAGHGSMTLAGTTGLTFENGADGSNDTLMVFNGSLANINTALNGLVFNPDLDFNGSASLEIKSEDLGQTGAGGDKSDTDTVTITVTAVNDAPVNTVPGDQSVNEDNSLTFSTGNANALSTSDVDAGSSPLKIDLSLLHGTLSLSSTTGLTVTGNSTASVSLTGSLTDLNNALSNGAVYTPDLNWSGSDTLTMVTNDQGNTGSGGAKSDTDTVSITVTGQNDAPVLTAPSSAALDEDTNLIFSSANSNAISGADVDAGPVSVSMSLNVSHGVLTFSNGMVGLTFSTGDGTNDASMVFQGSLSSINNALNGLKYVPDLNYNGTDTLNITLDDQGNTGSGTALSDSKSVGITINAVNDAPVNSLPAAQTTNEDTNLVFSAANGNLLSIGDVDAGASDVQVSLSVDQGALTLAGTTGLTFSSGSGTGDASMTFRGSLSSLNTALDGFTYIPPAGYNGAVLLSITTDDLNHTGSGGTKTDSDTLNITVSAVNDAPVNQVPAPQNTNEDTNLIFSTANANTISINDDSGTNPIKVALTATNGSVTLAGTNGLTITTGDGSADVTTSFTGTLVNINTALNGLIFTPDSNYNGAASLQIQTDDQGATGSGGALTDDDTISITVNAVNDAPVNHVPAAQTTAEDTSLVFSGAKALSVADVDLGSSALKVTLSVTNGKLSLASLTNLSFSQGDGSDDVSMTFTGALVDVNTALGGITFAPDQHFNGSATLTIVSDDQGSTGSGGALTDTDTVTIDVTAVNNAPVNSVPTTQSVNEDNTLTLSTANVNNLSVSDLDAGTGSLQIGLSVLHGTLNLTSTTNLSVTGNNTNSITATGQLADLNNAFSAGLAYTPSLNFNGDDTLTMLTNDQGNTGSGGAKSDTDTLTITVNAINDAPVLTAPSSAATNENMDLIFSVTNLNQISAADVDAGTADVQFSLSVAHGTLSLKTGFSGLAFTTGDGTADASMTFTGKLTDINSALNGLKYTPETNYSAGDTLDVSVNDQGNTGSGGALSDSKSIPITIDAINDPPVNHLPTAQNVNEDNSLTFTTGNQISVTDVDASTFDVQVTLGVNNGTLSLFSTSGLTFGSGDGNADASMTFSGNLTDINTALNGLVFNPPADYNGNVTLSITSDDLGHSGTGGAKTDTDTLTITVNAINDAPVNTVPGAQSTSEDTPLSLSGPISVADVDAGSQPVQVDLSMLHGKLNLAVTTGLTVTGNNTSHVVLTGSLTNLNNALSGSVTYSPDTNYNGSDTITVTSNDQGYTGAGGAKSDTDTISVSISGTNNAPTGLTLTPSSLNENNPIPTEVGTLAAQDPDIPYGDTFTFTLLNNTSTFEISGTKLNAIRSLDFETQSSYTVGVRVTDSGNLSKDVDLTITVNDINDVPSDIKANNSTSNILSVEENKPVDTEVAALAAVDQDAGDTHTYFLYPLDTSGDNVHFKITGNKLLAKDTFDYETLPNSFSIQIQTVDSHGGSFVKTYTVNVSNVNEAPSDITLDNSSVAENLAIGSLVGNLSTTDPDNTSGFTYTLLTGGSTFQISGGQLQTKVVLDYETMASYNIRIQTTDPGGLTYAKDFTITVLNANDPPTDISLSANTIAENSLISTPIGNLTSTDPDSSTFTYSLVNTGLYPDNALFGVNNSAVPPTLVVNGALDYETATHTYTIQVRSNDGAGGTFDKVFTINITNVNENPYAILLSNASIAENSAVGTSVGTFSTNDPDVGDTFVYSFVTGSGDADNGSFSISGNTLKVLGALDYESKPVLHIRVRTTDQNGAGLSYDDTFAINLTDVNEPPTDITLSPSSINENQPSGSVVGDLTTTDPDAGSSFTYSLVTGTGDTDNALFTIAQNGAIWQVKSASIFDFEVKNSYSIRVRTTDNGNLTFDKVFTIGINNLNDGPTNIALSSSSVAENLSDALVGSLSSTDQDSTVFTYSLTGTGNDNAKFSLAGDKLYTVGAFDFESTAPSHQYTIHVQTKDETNLTFEKDFVITITDVNERPVLTSLNKTTLEDTAYTFAGSEFNTSSNFNDPDTGSTAHAMSVLQITSLPAHGSLKVNTTTLGSGDLPYDIQVSNIGQLSYLPDANWNGSDSFNWNASDGSLFALVEAQVTMDVTAVNDIPALDTINNLTISEDSPEQVVSITGISAGPNEGTQTIQITAASSNTAIIPDPVVNYTSGASGDLRFTPVANAYTTTPVTITVTVKDNGGVANSGVDTKTTTFTVTVTPVNDTPVITVPAAQTTLEDTALAFSTTNANRISVADDAGSNPVKITLTATNGALTLSGTTGLSFEAGGGDGTSDALMKFSGTLTDVNNALNGMSFLPTLNTNLAGTVQIDIDDQGYTGGGALTASQSVTINITPANDPPTLTIDVPGNQMIIPYNADWQTAPLINISAGGNETQTLVVTAVSDNTAVIPNLNANLTVTYTSPNTTGQVDFKPLADTNGTVHIDVTVSDGSATATQRLTVIVAPGNLTPTLDAITDITINEDAGQQTINLTGIGSGGDPGAQTLVVTASSSNTSIIPDPSVVYTSPDATGSLRLTPQPNANGDVTITVTVDDQQLYNNQIQRTFVVHVLSINDAPAINALNPMTINEDAGQQTVNLAGISSGASNENQTLTITAVSSNTGLIPNPTVTYTSPQSSGSLQFTPVANMNGASTITVTVRDNGGTSNGGVDTLVRTFLVTVNAVNDVPSFTAGGDVQAKVDDGPKTAPWATNISAGPANEAGQTLTFEVNNDNPGLFSAQPAIASNGTLSFTGAAGATGLARVTVILRDNGGTANGGVDASASVNFVISIQANGHAPTAVNDTLSVASGATVELDVLANDSDADGDTPLTIVSVTNPQHGTLEIINSGSKVRYTSTANYSGTDSFTYTITDNHGGIGTAQVNLTVNVEGTFNASGGTMAYVDPQGDQTIITMPAGAVSQDVRLVYTALTGPAASNPGYQFAGTAFNLDAFIGSVKQENFQFAQPLTLRLYYRASDIVTLLEQTVRLFYWTNGSWQDAACSNVADNYVINLDQNYVDVKVCHLTQFALFGQQSKLISIPLITK